MNKRVVFLKPGAQTLFLKTAFARSGLSIKNFAGLMDVNQRTLNDWRNERATLPLPVLVAICKKFNIPSPKKIEVREANWSNKKSSVLGGNATYKKYGAIGGDVSYRKEQWQKWWKNNGYQKLPSSFYAIEIKKPRKNTDLAEFIGIMLGDGHIAPSQVTITLNATSDTLYIQYVARLVEKLFDITPSLFKRENMNAVVIIISRKKLVEFLGDVGLYPGNKTKQQVDIPGWVKKSQTFSKACVRGLMDTDGSVVNECHTIKSKKYCYKRLVFTNASQPLLLSVFKILEGLDFSPKMRNNRRVQLENNEEIGRYFKTINTSNPKHLARFNEFARIK